MNNRAARFIFAVIGLALLAPPAFAQEQPRPPRPDFRQRGDWPNRPREWWRDRAGPPATRPVSDEEWDEIEAFMKSHSPKRWARLSDVPPERQTRVRNFVAERYRMLAEMKQSNPPMYDIRVKRLPIEDEVFSLGWDLTHGSGEQADQTRQKLREQVRKLVDSRLQERRLRLEQMKDRVDKEQNRIKEDESRTDEAVDAQVAGIENGTWPVMGDLTPPGRRGFGRGRDPGDTPPASQPSPP